MAAGLARAETALEAAVTQAKLGLPSADPDLVSALHQARSRLRSARRSLGILAEHLGLEPLAVGPLDKPEDNPPIGGGPRRARRPRNLNENLRST